MVNTDSQIPNAVVAEALKNDKIDGFKDLTYIKREHTYRNSRFDIYYETPEVKGFIEVKGVTLEENGVAIFPDAPTERGTKHVHEMIEAVKEGYRGVIFFLIQMKGPHLFKPNWKMDKGFSEAVKLASKNGVEILAYDSIINRDEVVIGTPVKVDLTI